MAKKEIKKSVCFADLELAVNKAIAAERAACRKIAMYAYDDGLTAEDVADAIESRNSIPKFKILESK